ncbi:MAG: hypothetical protein HOY71_26665 [Nonomuraea sp.]|nr:hypothetical protein [Nonomuraea sp.]
MKFMIPALALLAGMAVASPAVAKASATSCRVEVDHVTANSVDEKDGTDEMRIDLAGFFYPPNGRYVAMSVGNTAYSGNFTNPTTTIGTTGYANFSLREVDPPIVGSGTNLGSINAYGSTCAGLARGQLAYISKTISGTDKTFYSYYIKLVMTGL